MPEFNQYEVGRDRGGLLLVAVRSSEGKYRAGISTAENLFYFHNVRHNVRNDFSPTPSHAWTYLGVNSRFADIDFGNTGRLLEKSLYGSVVAPKENPVEADDYTEMLKASRLWRFLNVEPSEGIMGLIHHPMHGWLWSIIAHEGKLNFSLNEWEKV